MLLEENNYNKKSLENKTVLITGGGGGIGFEASRAFSYMGAKVIIAEIDSAKGEKARQFINYEFKNENIDFYQIDISDEEQINKMYEYITEKYNHLDVIINNAAFVPMGAIDAVNIIDWDRSYAVNLRAPILLLQKFLPSMKNTGGIIVFNPSAPGAYMSAYEIFKTAQVELCNTLFEETVGTKVITYAITPGFVKTDTAIKAVEVVASSMKIAAEDFYKTLEDITVDAEIAGTGYAVSVVNAKQYHGKEIMSLQVLSDLGLIKSNTEKTNYIKKQTDYEKLKLLFTEIADVFYNQYHNWQKKKLFQKQFILSDFKKQMGIPAEYFKTQLEDLQSQIQENQWDNFLNGKDPSAPFGTLQDDNQGKKNFKNVKNW